MRFSVPKLFSKFRLINAAGGIHGRRSFLRYVMGFVAGYLVLPISSFAQVKKQKPSNAVLGKIYPTMKAVVDTLIPADDLSPAASAFKIEKEIIANARAEDNPRIAVMLNDGCSWLDKKAGGSFANLNKTKQIELLKLAENQTMSSTRTFFVHMRKQTMELYYANPRASNGFFDYNKTPQPRGYPGYTNPPKSGNPS